MSSARKSPIAALHAMASGNDDASPRSGRERYRDVFENSPDGILLFHAGSGQILDVNARASEMLGYSLQEAVTFRVPEFPPFEPASAGRRILEGCGSGTGLYWEERLASKTGDAVDCEILGAAYGEGGHRAVQLNLRRIAPRKVERLAGGVAHRFNNLLTGIMGNASLVADDLLPGSRKAALLQHVIECAAQGAELTGNLLAYAGVDALRTEDIDLSGLIFETANQLAASIPPRIKMRLEPGTNLPPLRADRRQIQLVIRNLVCNAAEAIPGDGKVELRALARAVAPRDLEGIVAPHALCASRCVAIEVEDTGTGIPEGIRPLIFDPFFSTRFAGRGLGLAVVACIVRRHGGGIQVECGQGRGSTFRVLLPAAGGGPGDSPQRYAPGWYTQRGSSAR